MWVRLSVAVPSQSPLAVTCTRGDSARSCSMCMPLAVGQVSSRASPRLASPSRRSRTHRCSGGKAAGLMPVLAGSSATITGAGPATAALAAKAGPPAGGAAGVAATGCRGQCR